MNRKSFGLAALAAIVGWADLYLALIWSPPEKEMHDLVRIMYFHVTSAWIAFFAFFVAFVGAICYLIRRTLRWDTLSVCSAEIGWVYTTITLISGSLWARPIWNTWWTWDPRLTTTLILWFLFVAYLLLRGTVSGVERRARISAIYAVIAFIDVPIIHMSVVWWRSIHPTVIDNTGFHMPPSMVVTLLFGFVTFLVIYVLLMLLRVRLEHQRMQVFQLHQEIRALYAEQEGGQ